MDGQMDGVREGEREIRNKSESAYPYISESAYPYISESVHPYNTMDTLYKSLSICCNITIVTILQGSSQYIRDYNS